MSRFLHRARNFTFFFISPCSFPANVDNTTSGAMRIKQVLIVTTVYSVTKKSYLYDTYPLATLEHIVIISV